MTKQYKATREALSRVRKARIDGVEVRLPNKLLQPVYIALASMEKYLKDNGLDAPDPNEGPDFTTPDDLVVARNEWGVEYAKICAEDLAENGGGLLFEIPPTIFGHTPWKVHCTDLRPDGVGANDRTRVMLKGTQWVPGRNAVDYSNGNRAKNFTWAQGGSAHDVLFYCRELRVGE